MTVGAAAAEGDESPPSNGGPFLSTSSHGIDYQRAFNRLCHLVPLTEGKADDALDDVVVTALVLAGDSVRGVAGVVEAVGVFFAVTLHEEQATASVARLTRLGMLLHRGRGRITVAPDAEAGAKTRIEEGHRLEERVRNVWLASTEASATGVAGSVLWQCLRTYMASVFQTHGMLAIELLDPTIESPEGDASAAEAALTSAVVRVPDGATMATRSAIQAFFVSPDAQRSRYIAQMLDATFTLFAMTLDETVADCLGEDLDPLDLFLDTNVLFGLLDLDTDARGQSAKELVRFIHHNEIPFKLYYHEETLGEIERTVSGFGSSLRAKQIWPQEISRAALDRRILGELRGVERRYHEINSETPISPKDFLSKYEHVQDLLEGWGVRLFRSSGIPPYSAEEKGTLIAEYDAYVKARRPNDPKQYEALDHDATVWLDVKYRGQVASTSLKAGALFVTNDLVFRQFISLGSRRRAPRVVLPSQLLQVLRPYGRRSGEVDERFVATLCLPEFRTAHSGYGPTQSKVLGFLANFKDVETETAVRILANEVLMRRVRDMDGESEDFKTVIESHILDDNARLVGEREAAAAELERLQRDAIQRLEEKDRVLAEGTGRQADLEEQLASALRKVTELEEMACRATGLDNERRKNLKAKSDGDAAWMVNAICIILCLGLVVPAVAGLVAAGMFSAGPIIGGLGVLAVVAAAVFGWFRMKDLRAAAVGKFQPRLFRRYLARLGETV